MRVTNEIIYILTEKYQIQVDSFCEEPPIEGEMSSGYLINYQRSVFDSNSDFRAECLDVDHVNRELEAQGLDRHLIDFILKNL